MAEAGLVTLADVEDLDVVEQDRAELAAGELLERPWMCNRSRLIAAHVD
jgi:hypothetical protein